MFIILTVTCIHLTLLFYRELVTLSKCIDDPVAYTNLNDSIFHVILMSTDKELAKSREILQRIERRQLYKCVGETTPTEGKTKV